MFCLSYGGPESNEIGSSDGAFPPWLEPGTHVDSKGKSSFVIVRPPGPRPVKGGDNNFKMTFLKRITRFIISTIMSFYHIRTKERANMRAYYTVVSVLHCSIPVYITHWIKWQKMAGKQCSYGGIINPLFDGIRCSHFSSPQLVKYPRVLSVKPSNKVFFFSEWSVSQTSNVIG